MERDEPLTLLDCGCRVFSFNDGYNVDITFCPIHNAAPDLLEALELATRFVGKYVADTESVIGKRALDRMNAAIAKARGGE